MLVYFFGSISGGTKDIAKWYRPMIQYVKRKGFVLSEDIFFNPDILEGKEDGFSDLDIFKRDVELINRADVLIGDVTIPSHGVGWEIRHAQGKGKPVLCLYRTGSEKNLTPMIAGNPHVVVRRYNTIKEAQKYIDEFFAWVERRKINKNQSWISNLFN